MPSRFKRSTKRLLLLALLPVAVVVLGTLYMLGMDHLEGTPRTFLESIQWASETLTTTGYGADNRWKHPVVALFVIVGQFIGPRASSRISPPAEGMHMLGTKAGLAEFRVRAGSPLAARRLGDLQLREQQGVTVIGQWHGGVFTTTRGPETLVEPGAILVVVGAFANLETVERMAMPIRRTGPIVLAGFGTVGHKVIEVLHDAGESCVVIDKLAAPGVDIVGNVLEGRILERAGVREASAMILALSDDSESVFATAPVARA